MRTGGRMAQARLLRGRLRVTNSAQAAAARKPTRPTPAHSSKLTDNSRPVLRIQFYGGAMSVRNRASAPCARASATKTQVLPR